MAITLTENAARRVQDQLRQRGRGLGLRVAIKRTGCSGYAYDLDFADDVLADDVVFEDRGIKLVVNTEALPLVDGTELDFIKEGLNEAFRFSNPNAAGECGCGESFNI